MYKVNEGLIFNEKEKIITSLSYGSKRRVKKLCPMCKSEKDAPYNSLIRYGHSYCNGCIRIKNNISNMIGKNTEI